MTTMPMTTSALSHLTCALISLDDAVKARDFFRNSDVGVSITVTLTGETPVNLPAAVLAGEQLNDAAHDPELVLQALVRQNVKQVIDALDNLRAVALEDLRDVSGFNDAVNERAIADLVRQLRTGQ